jgi:tetratricopeptide (TPR) repeat protein
MRGGRVRCRLVALAPVVALWAAPAVLDAQTDPRLQSAVRLAQEGMADSARALVARLLASTAPADPLYPEVLYTTALVAEDVEARRLHLLRVAVEHARSPWADHALLQLAQLAYAERDLEGAVRHVSRLLSDYPASPVRAAGALWGARAALDRRDLALACQWADLGLQAASADVELRNQLEFQRDRCRAMVLADTARARPGTPPPPPPAARPPATGTWFVQVAALRTQQAAASTQRTVERLGFAATTVRDGGFYKVRAGPFPSRAEASAALPRLRRELGGQPFVLQVTGQ